MKALNLVFGLILGIWALTMTAFVIIRQINSKSTADFALNLVSGLGALWLIGGLSYLCLRDVFEKRKSADEQEQQDD